MRLKFEAFGPVEACWVIRKEVVTAYIRFRFAVSARAAAQACARGEVHVSGGIPVECRLWDAGGPPEGQPSVAEEGGRFAPTVATSSYAGASTQARGSGATFLRATTTAGGGEVGAVGEGGSRSRSRKKKRRKRRRVDRRRHGSSSSSSSSSSSPPRSRGDVASPAPVLSGTAALPVPLPSKPVAPPPPPVRPQAPLPPAPPTEALQRPPAPPSEALLPPAPPPPNGSSGDVSPAVTTLPPPPPAPSSVGATQLSGRAPAPVPAVPEPPAPVFAAPVPSADTVITTSPTLGQTGSPAATPTTVANSMPLPPAQTSAVPAAERSMTKRQQPQQPPQQQQAPQRRRPQPQASQLAGNSIPAAVGSGGTDDTPVETISMVLEVRNMPVTNESKPEAPEEYLLDMLNQTLEILPDYDRSKGPAVVRTWAQGPGICRMELQSPQLVRSAARVVDGLVFFGNRLSTQLVE